MTDDLVEVPAGLFREKVGGMRRVSDAHAGHDFRDGFFGRHEYYDEAGRLCGTQRYTKSGLVNEYRLLPEFVPDDIAAMSRRFDAALKELYERTKATAGNAELLRSAVRVLQAAGHDFGATPELASIAREVAFNDHLASYLKEHVSRFTFGPIP